MKIYDKYKIKRLRKEINRCMEEITRIEERIETYTSLYPQTGDTVLETARLYREWRRWNEAKKEYEKNLNRLLIKNINEEM